MQSLKSRGARDTVWHLSGQLVELRSVDSLLLVDNIIDFRDFVLSDGQINLRKKSVMFCVYNRMISGSRRTGRGVQSMADDIVGRPS